MSAKAKIVFAGVNLLCFFYTLITPSQITFFAIVPTIIAGMSWLFSAQKNSHTQKNVQYWYIAVYVLVAIFCLFLGLTTEIMLNNNQAGQYILKVKSDILLLANAEFDYWPFALAIAISSSFLIIAEAVCDIKNSSENGESPVSLPQEIKAELNKLD